MCLFQSEIRQLFRVYLQGDGSRAAGSKPRRLHLASQVGRQVHELRHHCLVAVVENMELLDRHVATIYIVEEDLVLVCQEVAKGVRIFALEVALLLYNDPFECQQKRLVGGIAVYTHLFLKMSQLLGIVDGAHGEFLPRSDRAFRIGDRRAAARGLHIADEQRLVATVLHLKLSLDGMLVHHLPTVDRVGRQRDGLRLHKHRHESHR